MRFETRRRAARPGLALLSLMWLLVGIAGGMMLDRQVLAGTWFFSTQPSYSLMRQAWHLIGKYYVDRSAIDPRHATYAAISGMVDSLGDTGHSAFLSPQMVRESKEALQGHFPGIGAEVRIQDKQVVIVAPLDGSPAQRAGLLAGDVIFKVDGKDTAGVPLEQVVRWIRGPAGTQVVLSIRSPHTDQSRAVTVTRAEIHVQSVSWHFLPGTRIADLRIASFDEATAKDLAGAAAALRAQDARGVVLDLRNNPGGLLSQAVDVASQFLSGGNVLLEKDVKGHVQPVAVNQQGPKLNLPMVVLTNAGTASAAEIVTGALQDAKRAEVVGEKTFGTGTVLEEFGLSDGSALMLAVQEWLTPNGHTIWHQGITPNLTVSLADNVFPVLPEDLKTMSVAQFQASKDTQLLKALAILQRPAG